MFLITVAWCGFGRWCSLSSIGWFFSCHQFVDATAICWQVGQSVKHLPLTDESVHKVGVTIKLVLQKQIHGLCYYIKSPTHCIFKKLSKKLLNRQSWIIYFEPRGHGKLLLSRKLNKRTYSSTWIISSWQMKTANDSI